MPVLRPPTHSITILRAVRRRRSAMIAGFLLVVAAAPAAAQLDSGQRACVLSMNGDGGKVAQAQGKENAACVSGFGKGSLVGTAQSCLTADAAGRVLAKRDKTTSDESSKCTEDPPSFGYSTAAIVNSAAQQSQLNLVEDVYGSNLDSALASCSSDPDRCSCQQKVQKAFQKLADTKLRTFLSCKKSFLESAASAADLARCFSDASLAGSVANDEKLKIAKAYSKLRDALLFSCEAPDVTAGSFPGACDLPTYSAIRDCIGRRVDCRLCQIVRGMDALPLDCEDLDDGLANDSCPNCGDKVTEIDEGCDDGNMSNLDACLNTCVSASCGDGFIQTGAETCEDGNASNHDACPSTCVSAACGDGFVRSGVEVCDDGNQVPLDGCSAACALEQSESEPNEDGSVSTGGAEIYGNDFGSALANGPYSANTMLGAAISPAGDEDVYKFENNGPGEQVVTFETWDTALGVGVPCGGSIDTGIVLRTSAGTLLDFNHEGAGVGEDPCSGVVHAMAPGDVVYVQVVENGDDQALPSYALQARYETVVCGDDVLQGDEGCDDGNVVDGDGCSSNCQTPAAAEVEPNNTLVEANRFLTIRDDKFIVGSIGIVGDLDIYKVVLKSARTIDFAASGGTIDMRLFDAAGTQLAADTVGSGITMLLATGTYFIQVEERGNDSTTSYFLNVDF